MFDQKIELKEREVELKFLKPQKPVQFAYEKINRKELFERNVKFSVELNTNNYVFLYSADLCLNGFEYKGYGTVWPTYYNLKLKLVNQESSIEQVVYKYPHSHFYNISALQNFTFL